MTTLAVWILLCGACCAVFAERPSADDIFRRRTPGHFLRETPNLLSSVSDDSFQQKLRDLQQELLRTDFHQLFKDALDSGGVLLPSGNNDDDWNSGSWQMQEEDNMPQIPSRQDDDSAAFGVVQAGEDNTTTTQVYKNMTTEVETFTSATFYSTSAPNITTLSTSTTSENISTATSPSSNVTTAVPPTAPPVSPQCLEHMAVFVEALSQNKSWALRMIDAYGKPGPNILSAQLFWVGDYEECVNVTALNVTALDNSTGVLKGHYCTAVIPLQPMDTRPIMPAVPPSGIRVGVCMPDTCSSQDITHMLNTALTAAGQKLRVGLTTCQQQEIDYDAKAIVALFICSLFLLAMVLGTACDLLLVQWPSWSAQAAKESQALASVAPTAANSTSNSNSNRLAAAGAHRDDSPATIAVNVREESEETVPLLDKEQKKTFDVEKPNIGVVGRLLMAFSVYTNGKKILTASHGPGSIACIHGIRFLSITWVILGHTFIFGLTTAENYFPYLNTTRGQWTFQAIIGAPASVDTFFSLSGLLVAYLILKEMERREGKVNWFLFYFHRFWRLTPPYMLVMMMLVCLFRYMGQGPNWPQDGTEINNCQDTWWTNLLYVSNFVHVKEMCINWSWYLANDMQFYVVSPLLFVPLYRWGRVGVALCWGWLLATLTTAGLISSLNTFPPSISVNDPANVAAGVDYFFDFYIKPYCRFGPYVIGMLTGYALFVTRGQVKLNLATSLSGWAVATAAGLAVVYGLYEPVNGHPLTNNVSALYNALSHSVWAACVCWVIFACATGHGGPVNTLLSWTAFIPLSRLTYMTYLIHPIVINLYQLGAPSAFFMSTFHLVILFLGFTVASFGIAFLLSLAFEAPMMALEKVLLSKPRKH